MKIELGNGIIPGGMGTEVKNLLLREDGDGIDYGEDMFGYIHYGDTYTSAWHDGEFQEIYTDVEATVSEFNETRADAEEFSEYKKLWTKTFNSSYNVTDVIDYLESMKIEDIDKDEIKKLKNHYECIYLIGEVK